MSTHPVYPGGPDCQPNCPGPSSMYHDGYADGYERGERLWQVPRAPREEEPVSTTLDELWDAMWEDLRHNATGRPSGVVIVAKHRPAIEAEARAAVLDELRTAVEGLPNPYPFDVDPILGPVREEMRAAVLALIDRAAR